MFCACDMHISSRRRSDRDALAYASCTLDEHVYQLRARSLVSWATMVNSAASTSAVGVTAASAWPPVARSKTSVNCADTLPSTHMCTTCID